MRPLALWCSLAVLGGCVSTPRAAATGPSGEMAPPAEVQAAAPLPELTEAKAESCAQRLNPADLRAAAAWVGEEEAKALLGVHIGSPDRLGGRLSGTPWIEGCASVEDLKTHPVTLRCAPAADARQVVVGYAFACADGLFSVAVTTQLDRAKKTGEPLRTSAEFKRLSEPRARPRR